MRLDKEDVKDIKEALVCDKDRRPLSYTCCIELIETIEGLYDDVDSLMEQLNRNIFAMDDAEAKIEALQQENEQLQAQNAAMREMIIDKTNALKKIFNKMNYTGHAWMPLDEIDDFLASDAQQADYHNPADVAEIERLNGLVGCGCGICLAHNNMICPRLVKKDKVIGGKEDDGI